MTGLPLGLFQRALLGFTIAGSILFVVVTVIGALIKSAFFAALYVELRHVRESHGRARPRGGVRLNAYFNFETKGAAG